MEYIKKYSFLYLIIVILLFSSILTFGQVNTNVQVKVYDQALNPLPNTEIKIADEDAFTTNARGIAFVALPKSELPPSDVKVNDQSLEVESWNYSKGVLEIILRKKRYRHVSIELRNTENDIAVPNVPVSINAQDTTLSLRANPNGVLTFTFPINETLNPNAFTLEGYKIIRSELSKNGGVLVIEQNLTDPGQEQEEVIQDQQIDDQIQKENLSDLSIENLDSVTSITVLYSLMKNLNLKELDNETKQKLDSKFNELINDIPQTEITTKSPLELITDSSIINDDIKRIAERIRLEKQLLIDLREKFEYASEQIRSKLKDGGQNLSEEERQELVQEVLNLRELLRQNEELFYRNNAFYNQQINSLLSQLADIYELEDLLTQSEKESSEMRKNIIIFFFAFVVLSSIVALLIYLVRVFRSQKNDLAKANEKIQRMNANLEGLINEKTESLRLINHELDTFLYRSSHNLKGPITTIKGLANIANITLDKEATLLFEKVVSTTKGMERMLDKLVMMNQLNSPEDFGEVNINHLVDKLQNEGSATIKRRGITFSANLKDKILFNTYPSVIEIILYNLLENALYFSQFAYGKKPKVELTIKKDQEENLLITIWDNGCGIDPELISKIYNMFYVGNEASKGSGLGLYITKKAVETLHGQISVEAKDRAYFKVMVSLPLFQPSQDTGLSKADAIES